MNCPICQAESNNIFKKGDYDYLQCSKCNTVFVPNGIDQSNMVGGGFELERNVSQNQERIERFKTFTGIYGKILDFGSGHGYLVNDCVAAGLSAEGYDKFNPQYEKIPDGKFNLVSLVECVEHLYFPYSEFDIVYNKLADNGICYIESSFIDICIEDNIPLNEFFYISPEVGHCTIFSHIGLDVLMARKGFIPLKHLNRNTRIYKKK